MDDVDLFEGFVAYMAYLNDPTEQSANDLAEILHQQHPHLPLEYLREQLRHYAGEVRVFNEADCARACEMLNRLIRGERI